MPHRQTARALELWREGERILESSPPYTADAADLQAAVNNLRSAYASLADTPDVSAELLARATDMIDEAEAVIVRARSAQPPPGR
jgi:hypothetical protein